MTDAWIVLGLVVGAMAMFAIERVPMEVASLALIAALAVTGVLTPEEAFSGISNETVIFIFTLLAMTEGLASTGVMQIVGRRAAFVRQFGERSFLAGLLGVVTSFSSLASNTAVTAAFLPVASAAAARARIPRSRVLLPMAYASMLGGMVFLYGTSTNLIGSEAMRRMGMQPIGFAELTPVGLPAALLSIVLILFVGHRLMPNRAERGEDAPLAHREFVTEATIPPGSRLIGRTVGDISSGLDFDVIGLLRRGYWVRSPHEARVRAGDRLMIRGGTNAVLRVKDLRSMVLQAELLVRQDGAGAEPTMLAETFVPPHSPLIGQRIREFLFNERLGLTPLAIHRHPGAHSNEIDAAADLGDVELSAGDVLLVSGPPRRLRELSEGGLLDVLGSIDYRRPRYRKAVLATLIFAASIGAAGAGLLPPAIAGLLGLLAMIATRCADVSDAFRIEWRVVLLIGSLLALGLAMEKSGAGEILARNLVPLAETIGARGMLFVVMLLTVLLSAPMSNQAAALVVLPVAVSVAVMLGHEARPFAIATCLAASCSFMTPLEPSAALVYGPGHYRFADFLKAGTPLTLVLLVFLTAFIPMVWPL